MKPSLIPSPIKISLALISLLGTAACSIPRDVPTKATLTSASPMLNRSADLQTRLNSLNSNQKFALPIAADAPALTASKYDWAKAQCWVRNSYSEQHERDAAGFPVAALDEAQKIIQGLEAGNNTYKATALINHAKPVRPDLWARAEKIKQSPGFACAAATTACMEVQLSRSGHEHAETGWRHANSYVAIAEDMADRADKEAANCAPPVRVVAVVPPPAPPPAKTIEKINLDPSALFHFDKRGPNDLLPKGKATLDELATRLDRVYSSVESIVLTGYTDRLGSASYNAKLSADRADTVKAYLQAQGVRAPMTTSGRGPADPIVECPGTKPTPQLTDCLQPNRRVEVLITGIKK